MRRLAARLGPMPQSIKAGPASGLTMYAPLGERGSYRDGRHEPHVMAALTRLVRPGMVAADVGSHLGYFALALAQLVRPSGHVYAFEPLPRHVAWLDKAVRRNRLVQLTIVPEAVGDHS